MTQRNIFLIDGATGSELDRAGVDIGMPLWSANAILEAPEILKQVHIAYLEAGAQAIIANTFRTHERSLAKAGMGDRAEELTHKAVRIARSACDEVNSNALVYGSVAPLEDCYSPELAPRSEVCEREHGQLIRHLVNAGVDLVLIETMCSAGEVCAASVAAMENTENWAVSFCLQQKGVGILLDGNPISEFVPALMHASFIGINCYSATELAEQVKHLRSLLPDDMPIAAYGNVGYADKEGSWVSTDAIDPNRYATYAMDWIEAGASIIGGCCGTTPETIKAINSSLKNYE
ncbi:MAG TPA: homocysteine S-methyltransferase family protein [Phycisphaerales bacterium]|jgi:homocysteine S-methyltransferase|nr:homocysteine S-methyltransferase family protein [Phycisphaerales bacterium]